MKSRKGMICPRCGSVETQAIRTGWPEPELGQKQPSEGPPFKKLLGIDNPDRVCKKCGHQWQAGHK
ncbi:MAG: hypothetical protein ACREMQ_17630 [Longimicrobiales bacterium]